MEDKKRKRTTLILLALLALLIGLLIPFTWRSFTAVKASLVQENSLASKASETNPKTISGGSLHGGWIPSSTPTNRPNATSTATVPPLPTSTATHSTSSPQAPAFTATYTATITLLPEATSTSTASMAGSPTPTDTSSAGYQPTVTKTTQVILTSTQEVAKTESPTATPGNPTMVLVGSPEIAVTPQASGSTSTPTVTVTPPPPQTVVSTASQPLLEAETPSVQAPVIAPTVGPAGNPRDYSTLGIAFGLIAVAAFFLYFSGTVISKRKHL